MGGVERIEKGRNLKSGVGRQSALRRNAYTYAVQVRSVKVERLFGEQVPAKGFFSFESVPAAVEFDFIASHCSLAAVLEARASELVKIPTAV